MSDLVTADEAVADWVGCLVLPIAPKPHMQQIADAVVRAERRIFADPVLLDMARVATTSSPDPLGGDLDEIALTLHRELVSWAQSPARMPAPRITFCVLLVHPDIQEAERLMSRLAATSLLSELPIVFRIDGMPQQAQQGPEVIVPATTDEHEIVTHMILEAVAATAHEIDRTPGLGLTTAQLARLTVGDPPRPAPALPQGRHRVLEAGPLPDAVARPVPSAPVAASRDAAQRPNPEQPDRENGAVEGHSSAAGAGGQPEDATSSALDRLASSVNAMFARRRLPSSNIEVIAELSEHASGVSMLYVVLVAEPIRPSRAQRKRRVEVALALTKALMPDREMDADPLYVRAFSAGATAHAAGPLPDRDLLRAKDFPERWGEHFDLDDSIVELKASIERDTLSFVRRGLQPPRTMVVFLSGPAPREGAAGAQRMAELCADAETYWVSFDADAPVPDEFVPLDVHFLRYHEDLVGELCQRVSRSRDSEPVLESSATDLFASSEPEGP